MLDYHFHKKTLEFRGAFGFAPRHILRFKDGSFTVILQK